MFFRYFWSYLVKIYWFGSILALINNALCKSKNISAGRQFDMPAI